MTLHNIGKKILSFERLDSTNSKARELIREQYLPEGTIIKAHAQEAGRGYSSNSWESAPGKNITASWILRPEFLEPQLQFRLTQILSLALKETVAGLLPPNHSITIKWPNDIYVGNQKIAGILVENTIMGAKIKEAICGIGLNVNQVQFLSDAPNPVSLKILTHKDYDINELIVVVSEKINYWYSCLQTQQFKKIDTAYHASLFRLKQICAFESEGKFFKGTIAGTDPYGRLQIKTSDGKTEIFDFKEVKFIL